MRQCSSLLAVVLAAALAAPVPALARDRSLGRAAEQLGDPQLQHSIASAIAALSEAMLAMKMAPFARAMEGMGEMAGDRDAAPAIDPEATMGDMIGPEAREMPRQVPQMMSAMAGMAGAMEGMLPEFEALGKRLRRDMPRN